MSAFRAVLLALLVAGAVAAILPTAATAGDASEATGDATLDASAAQNETANGSSLGADISSFMQSNAAEVGGAVETGMWTAAYDATENRTVRTRLVERRSGDLDAELADLRERKQELADEREAGNVSDAAYKAHVGQIVGRINALESAIGVTETRARQVNASVENITRLRNQTEDLAGPEIATVARNLSGVGDGSDPGDQNGNANGVGSGSDGGNGDGVKDGNGVGNGNDATDAENDTTPNPNRAPGDGQATHSTPVGAPGELAEPTPDAAGAGP